MFSKNISTEVSLGLIASNVGFRVNFCFEASWALRVQPMCSRYLVSPRVYWGMEAALQLLPAFASAFLIRRLRFHSPHHHYRITITITITICYITITITERLPNKKVEISLTASPPPMSASSFLNCSSSRLYYNFHLPTIQSTVSRLLILNLSHKR